MCVNIITANLNFSYSIYKEKNGADRRTGRDTSDSIMALFLLFNYETIKISNKYLYFL